MIRKVALVQALREAFPETFTGLYIAEEVGTNEPEANSSDVFLGEQDVAAIPQQDPVSQAAFSQPQPAETENIEKDFFN